VERGCGLVGGTAQAVSVKEQKRTYAAKQHTDKHGFNWLRGE